MTDTRFAIDLTPVPDKLPFFTTLEEEWTFYENVASDLYELLDKVNLDYAALSYLGTQTADLEAMRYLLQKTWEHYKKLADEKSKLYFASAEFQND